MRLVALSAVVGKGNSRWMPVDGLADEICFDGRDLSVAVNSRALATFVGLASASLSLRCTSGAGAEETSPALTGLERGMTRTGPTTAVGGGLSNGCAIS